MKVHGPALPQDRPRRALAPLAPVGLAVLTLVAYLPFIGIGFVATDSLPLIATSRITSLADLLAPFTRPVMADTTFASTEVVYRPFVSVTFGLDYAAWGMNAIGYHLTNLALHLVGVLLVWRLLRLLGLQAWSSLLGAVVFALHPVVVASVPVIARRDSVVPVVAFVAAWVLLLEAERIIGPWRVLTRAGSVLLAAIALLSKESAFAAVALLLPSLVWQARARGAGWRCALLRGRLAAPHVLLAVVLFGVRLAVLGRLGGAEDPTQAIGDTPQILGAFTRDLVWSFGSVASSNHVIWPLLAATLLLGFGSGCLVLPRRQAWLAAMGLAWIVGFALFAMVFHIATVGWLAYFALLGTAIWWAAATEGAVLRVRELRRPLAAWPWPWRPATAGVVLLGLTGLGLGWLASSAGLRLHNDWQIAGDVSGRFMQALSGCVSSEPMLSHVRLEGVPTAFDDGHAETNQLGVTLFEDYTIQAALRLLFPERALTFTLWSRETLHGGENVRFTCSADSARVIFTAQYS